MKTFCLAVTSKEAANSIARSEEGDSGQVHVENSVRRKNAMFMSSLDKIYAWQRKSSWTAAIDLLKGVGASLKVPERASLKGQMPEGPYNITLKIVTIVSVSSWCH